MGKKILVVDDARTVRQQVGFTLDKDGYEIVEAEDGADALAKLAATPDIVMVISDVYMPNMNGLEMLEKIRALPDKGKIPVLMLTTEGSGTLIDSARQKGATGWMVKPFKPELLTATVSKILARAGA